MATSTVTSDGDIFSKDGAMTIQQNGNASTASPDTNSTLLPSDNDIFTDANFFNTKETPDDGSKKENSLKYAILASIVVSLGLNCGLFLWKAIKRRRDPAHAVLIGNLVASHMFTGIYLLLPFLDSTMREAGITERTPRRLCEIVSFLQMFSYEAYVGSLLVIAMDRVYSFRHPLTVTGLTPLISRTICSLVWLASVVAAGIYVALIVINPYKYNPYGSLSEVFLCWKNTIIMEYFMAITLWMNFALFAAICALYATGGIMKFRNRNYVFMETKQSKKERVFFMKTFGITAVCVCLWILIPIAVYVGNTDGIYLNTRVNYLLYIASMAGPSVINPIIYLIGSINCSHNSSEPSIKEPLSFGNSPSKRQVSIRLSNYLEGGDSLTPQDAVIMTSCLSTSVHTLHNLGMTASHIDPDHIMVEKDTRGALIDTHLIGLPVKPRRDSLDNRVQEDKEAIGQIFDCVMAHIKETNTNRLSAIDRRQTSIRLLKSLSVRNPRGPSMLTADAAIKRQDRPKSWKV